MSDLTAKIEHDLKVINALATVARPVLREYFEPRSCIASTRVGLDALEYFSVQAWPIPLFMMVYNPEAAQMLKDGVDLLEIKRRAFEFEPEVRGGPWTLGLGAEIEDSDGWAGHLVVGLPQYQMLLDLSADQANRPLKDIMFDDGQVYHVRNRGWWLSEEDHRYVPLEFENGTIIVLDRQAPDPDGYLKSKNWRRRGARSGPGVFREVTGRIIRLVRAEVGDA